MKSITLTIILLLSLKNIQAQNYQIAFAGMGASTMVDSVKVENLSECTSLSLAGTDVLNLTSTVGIPEPEKYRRGRLYIYPNPSSGYCSVGFENNRANVGYVALYDMSGKRVAQLREYLSEGYHTFIVTDIPEGIYNLSVEIGNEDYAAKVVSLATTIGKAEIKSSGPTHQEVYQEAIPGNGGTKTSYSTKSAVVMLFHAGDTLKLTGQSGNYKTVMMLRPTQSQIVSFNFVDCTDADGNHYGTVQIGQQLWMEENLKTTKYRDGSAIPNVQDSASWGSQNAGAYCDYHNDPAEGAFYGHLYNFYAVADSRNMCPNGWHVPSHSEWNKLEKYLDPSVDTTALMGTGNLIGRILKEGCGTRWQYCDSAYGFNSAGFTALCTNYRVSTGAWSLAPDSNHDCGFWTSTSYSTNSAWYCSLRWCWKDIYVLFPFKKSGNSVRCIKD